MRVYTDRHTTSSCVGNFGILSEVDVQAELTNDNIQAPNFAVSQPFSRPPSSQLLAAPPIALFALRTSRNSAKDSNFSF